MDNTGASYVDDMIYGDNNGDGLLKPCIGVNAHVPYRYAYAHQMHLIELNRWSPNESAEIVSWYDPSSITTRLWLDMDDQTITGRPNSIKFFISIADKSGNNYTFNATSAIFFNRANVDSIKQ